MRKESGCEHSYRLITYQPHDRIDILVGRRHDIASHHIFKIPVQYVTKQLSYEVWIETIESVRRHLMHFYYKELIIILGLCVCVGTF